MANRRSPMVEHHLRIPAGNIVLDGDLAIPEGAAGIVVFAHGSGSGRFSPRNRAIAQTLREAGSATLLLDLLTPHEEILDQETGHVRRDIGLLSGRLAHITDWLGQYQDTNQLGVGYFGASTGGGVALIAAAERPERVAAIVSRGGRPDLAGQALTRVRAPTLLIVGGADAPVIALNRDALDRMACEKRLEIVPGASHLFEEVGALEVVARLACDWFARYLVSSVHPPAIYDVDQGENLGHEE